MARPAFNPVVHLDHTGMRDWIYVHLDHTGMRDWIYYAACGVNLTQARDRDILKSTRDELEVTCLNCLRSMAKHDGMTKSRREHLAAGL